MQSIAAAARARIHEFQVQEISNTSWSFATLGLQNPTLRDALSSAAIARITEFGLQDLSNTVWAMASLR